MFQIGHFIRRIQPKHVIVLHINYSSIIKTKCYVFTTESLVFFSKLRILQNVSSIGRPILKIKICSIDSYNELKFISSTKSSMFCRIIIIYILQEGGRFLIYLTHGPRVCTANTRYRTYRIPSPAS